MENSSEFSVLYFMINSFEVILSDITVAEKGPADKTGDDIQYCT